MSRALAPAAVWRERDQACRYVHTRGRTTEPLGSAERRSKGRGRDVGERTAKESEARRAIETRLYDAQIPKASNGSIPSAYHSTYEGCLSPAG